MSIAGLVTTSAEPPTAPPTPSANRSAKKLARLAPAIGVIAVIIAAWLIYRVVAGFDVHLIGRSLRLLSWTHLGLALAFTIASYACLTGFDTLGLRWAGQSLPYRRIAFISFVSLSIGHTLGFAAFSTGTIRLRLYTTHGVSAAAVLQVIVSCGLTVIIGLGTLAGITAVASPVLAGQSLHLPPRETALVGVALLAVTATYLGLAALRPSFRIWRRTFTLPTFRLALGQVVVGTIDFLLVAAVLHQTLLAAGVSIDYVSATTLYVVATAAAIVTHAPGGLGVIEAVVLSRVPQEDAVAALIAFRALYYLIPFVIGCLLFGGFELWRYAAEHRGVSARPSAATRIRS